MQLDASGAGSITAAQVDNGSFDNCSIATMTLDTEDFTCADVGPNTVTMTVTSTLLDTRTGQVIDHTTCESKEDIEDLDLVFIK